MLLPSGTRLGPYEIVSALGAGGMGQVYKARDSRLDRLVAIKVLPEELAADNGRRERFEREARAVAALNHPHICDIHDVGENQVLDSSTGDVMRFLVMEFLEGQTLADRLLGGPLTTSAVLRYAVELADALDHAHRRALVHRDLKPANVMLTPTGAKLLDFGLSRLESSPDLIALSTLSPGDAPLTAEGAVLGTYPYMSPEQLVGRKADARSDMFSLGAVIYEMATGRRAFEGTTPATVIGAILHTEPPALSTLQPLVPTALDRVVARCLAKDPDERWQSASDLTFELRGIADKVAVTNPAVRSRPTSQPRLAWTAAAMAGLIAAVSAGGWWLSRDSLRLPTGSTASNAARSQGTPSAPPSALRVSSGGPASTNPEANRYFENAMQAKLAADVDRERQMLERALELDPHFAEARARYGFTNWLMIDGGVSNDGTLLYRAEDELRKAIQDEPTLGRAHAFFAAIYLTQGRKGLVPAELDLALKASPDDEDALHWRLQYHHYSGDAATAKQVAQRSLERHPLFFPTRMILGEMQREEGDLTGAIREQERILEQDPQSLYAISNLARTYLDSGDLASARQILKRARPGDRENYWLRLWRGMIAALEGRRVAALEEVNGETLKWGALHALFTSEFAEFYSCLGDAPKALEWLDLAVRNGDERAEWFRRDPLLAGIREHPQFQLIVQSADYSRKQRRR